MHLMKLPLVLLFLLINACPGDLSRSSKIGNEQMVFEHISQFYTKKVRPVINQKTRTTIYISPVLKCLTNVDEKEGALSYVHWLLMLWNDESLRWDPVKFNNITNIKIPANQLWIPDVNVESSQEMRSLRSLKETFASITYTGNITVQLSQLVTIQCDYHIADFPFDKQECIMPYTTWMYDATETQLLPIDQEFAHHETMRNLKESPVCVATFKYFPGFQSNPEWNITGYEAKVELDYYMMNGQNTSYARVVYKLKFERMPKWFIFTMVGPSFLITTIAIVGVFSPTNCDGQRGEKVTLGLTTLLTMAVMLNLVCEQMPQSSLETPLLGLFVFYEMCITSGCTCIAALVLVLHQKAVVNGWTPPNCFYKMPAVNCNGYVQDEDLDSKNEMNKLNEVIKVLGKALEKREKEKLVYAAWSLFFNYVDATLFFCALIFNTAMSFCVLGLWQKMFHYKLPCEL